MKSETPLMDNEPVKQKITQLILSGELERAADELESAAIDYPRIVGKRLISESTVDSFRLAIKDECIALGLPNYLERLERLKTSAN